MAAVAGDAERNINKQARKMRTNWVTNKREEKKISLEQANGDGRLLALSRSGGRPYRLAPRTAPPTHPSRTDHACS